MKRELPTIDRLHEVLVCRDDGLLQWKISPAHHIPAGRVASIPFKKVDRAIRVDGIAIRAHWVVFAMTHGRWPKDQIDHINGDPSDNRPENLRECCQQQNSYNRVRPQRNNTSGVTGVGWHAGKKKWQARIRACGRTIHLGQFDDLEEAAKARREAEKKYFGEFAPNRTKEEPDVHSPFE